jgi:hypothetical protein
VFSAGHPPLLGTPGSRGLGRPVQGRQALSGGAREWDWNETGTSHEPGIQPADVEELLDRGATVVVLSRGFHERLRVCPETLRMLEERKIPVYIEQTEEAVRLYNELSKENEKVGALVHSTC